jgi:hypothetical protein
MISIKYNENNAPQQNEVLSALLGVDSVFYAIFDEGHELKACNTVAYSVFQNLLSSASIQSFVSMDMTNKFILSDNSIVSPSESFDIVIDKFTGSSIFCKHLQHPLLNLNPDKHFVTALDHHYYLLEKDVLHVHFDLNCLHIYLKRDGHFIFYNNYEISTSDDVLYFVALVCQTNDVEVTSDSSLLLSGMVDEDSQYVKLLSKFYYNVKLAQPKHSKFNKFAHFKSHYFLGHIINLSCA